MNMEYFDNQLEPFLSFLEAYVGIESDTSNIEGLHSCVELLVGFAEKLKGCQCEKILSENGWPILKIKRPGEIAGKKILLLGHTDTVFPKGTISKNPFRIEDGNARGPGVSDMKSGVATMLFLLKAMEELGGSFPSIEVLITSDEETGSADSVKIIEDAAKDSLAVLLFEPGRENGGVVTGRKGVGAYRAIVKGKAAHAGTNHADGCNAIVEMAHKVVELAKLTDYENGNTINVGIIKGGTVSNAVPDACEIAVDVRYQKLDMIGDVNGGIESILKTVYTPGTSTEFAGGVNRPPMEQFPGNIALYEMYAKIAEELDYKVSHQYVGGGSDGNFTGALRIPTLDGMGPCGAKFHSDGEFMIVSTVAPRMCIAFEMLKLLGNRDSV